jgi:hypothetical protein
MISSIRLILPCEQALLNSFLLVNVLFSVSIWIFVSFTLLTLPLQTFTILSAHLLELYLCLPSAILVEISIFCANRPDMSSGLAGETTDLRRDMKTIEIKDRIISCGQKTTSLTPRRSRSCNKTYINIIM